MKADRDFNTSQRNKFIKDNGKYGADYEEQFLRVGKEQH